MSDNNPLDRGRLSALRHWGFVWDYNDDDGPGGFASGEFLLRSDGVLLRRYGSSILTPGKGTRWEYEPWQVMDGEAGTDVGEAARRLAARGYDLMKPGPVGIGESTAGPFPGAPPPAEKADDLN